MPLNNAGEAVERYVPHPGHSPRNLQIQWLRLSAALFVLLFHASEMSDAYLHDTSFVSIFGGRFAVVGVSLFFSISGYLMATAITVQKPFLFLAHRVIRIYPLLWVCYALYYGFYHFSAQGVPPLHICDLLLVPYGQLGGPFGVEWTLVYEMAFYLLIFAIGLLGLAARLPLLACLWLAVLAIGSCFSLNAHSPLILLQNILINPACVPLAAGLLIPFLLSRKIPHFPLLAIGAGLCFLAPVPASLDVARWFCGIGTSLLLAGAIDISAKRPNFGDSKAGRGMAKAADSTYALYLCHMPIIIFLYHAGLDLSPALLWLGAIAASLIVAAILGQGEVALYRRAKRLVNGARPGFIMAAMLAFIAVYLGYAISRGYMLQTIANRNGAAQAIAASLGSRPGADIDAIMQAGGYRKAPDLAGAVEGALWQDEKLSLWGWALDEGEQHARVMIVFFQNGRAVGGAGLTETRHDIERPRHTHRQAGFAVKLPVSCAPIEAVAVTKDGRYAILPLQTAPLSCP